MYYVIIHLILYLQCRRLTLAKILLAIMAFASYGEPTKGARILWVHVDLRIVSNFEA